jgi:hypothetical protein
MGTGGANLSVKQRGECLSINAHTDDNVIPT